MLTRRHLCCAASTGFLATFAAGKAAADECAVITPAQQASSSSPTEALSELIFGNQRFISGKAILRPAFPGSRDVESASALCSCLGMYR